MSNNAVLAALRSMGYPKETIVGHGFRSMFSTVANESGLWPPDAIELQLATSKAILSALRTTTRGSWTLAGR